MKTRYLAILPLLFLLLGSPIVHGQSQSDAVPMSQVLDRDGSIKLDVIRTGKIDPTGYRFELGKDGEPKFFPISTELEYRKVEGEANPQNLGATDENWNQDLINTVDRVYISAVAIKGNQIFIGGDFEKIDDQDIRDFAVYNTSTGQWSNLGLGMDGCCSVEVIEVFGNDVYVGGFFFTSNGISHLAKWNGSTWTAVGGNKVNNVRALTVAQGSVYVSGWFENIDGNPDIRYAAFWDGASWKPMGQGLPNQPAAKFEVNNNEQRVYASGCFGNITDGVEIPNTASVAYWDIANSSWNALAGGVSGCVDDMVSDGTNLFLVGSFFETRNNSGVPVANTSRIVRYSEASGFNSVYASNPNLNSTIWRIAEENGRLFVGGFFDNNTSNTLPNANKFAYIDWNGDQTWKTTGTGLEGFGTEIPGIDVENGTVVIGGPFLEVNGQPTRRFATFNVSGNSWTTYSSGPKKGGSSVDAVAILNDKLYVGGNFDEVGDGIRAANIAEYDLANGTWNSMDGGVNSVVLDLEVIGNSLYVGGYFGEAGGISTGGVAEWNGSSWIDIGAQSGGQVLALRSDGSDLYVGGYFGDFGGITGTSLIARYRPGVGWSSVGGGLEGLSGGFIRVDDIALDNGNVYAAGRFDRVAGTSTIVHNVAVFNGVGWTQVGTGLNEIISNDTFDGVRAVEAINGEVFIGGYWNQNEPRGSGRLQSNNTWSKLIPGDDYHEVTSFSKKGNTLIIGGYFYNEVFNTISQGVTAFNPTTDRWQDLGKGTWSVIDVFATNNQIAIGGGFTVVNSDLESNRIGVWNSPTVTTEALPVTNLTGRDVIEIPFTVTGAMEDGNTFFAELSDATGSFDNPTQIGSIPGTESGVLPAVIPLDVSGTGYKIRIISSTEANYVGEPTVSIQAGGSGLDYFWVGGSGNWTDVSHWATTSGGTTLHATPPTIYDFVFFDENSFSVDGETVTMNGLPGTVHDIDMSTVDQEVTFVAPDWSNRLTIYGSLVLSEKVTSQLRNLDFYSDQTETITPGKNGLGSNSVPGIFTAGSVFSLTDSLSTYFIDIWNGSLATDGNPVNALGIGLYSLESSMDISNSNIYINTLVVTEAETPIATNGSNIIIRGGGNLNGGANSFDELTLFNGDNVSVPNVTLNIESSSTFSDITIHPGADVFFSPGVTISCTNLSAIGTKARPIALYGSGFQLSVANSPTLEWVEVRNSTALGAVPFTANNSRDDGGNVGWIFNEYAGADYFWVGNGGNWSDFENHWATSSGGTTFHTGAPNELDNVFFDENSFNSVNQTVTLDVPSETKNIDWTGVTNDPLFASFDWENGLSVYGDLLFNNDFRRDLRYIYLQSAKPDTAIINVGSRETNGGAWYRIGWSDAGGTYKVTDTLVAEEIQFWSGGIDLGNKLIRARGFEIQGTANKNINANSVRIETQNFRSFADPNFLTFNALNCDIILDDGTFDGFGNSYNVVELNGFTRVFNSNTFETLIISPGAEISFSAGNTQTIQNFTASASKAEPIFISSTTEGNQALFNFPGAVVVDWAIIQDTNVTPIGVHSANNSIDQGNNDGWLGFNAPVAEEYYWVGGSGNWSDASNHWSSSSGGSPDKTSAPGFLDNVFFDANSFTGQDQRVTLDVANAVCNTMDWTGATGNPIFFADNDTKLSLNGSLIFSDGVVPAISELVFRSNETGNIIDFPAGTENGPTPRIIRINGAGDFSLADSLFASDLIINKGILNLNNFSVNVSFIQGGSSASQFNMGSSHVYTSYMDFFGQMQVDPGTSTLHIGNSGFGRLFSNGYDFHNITLYNDAYIYSDHAFSQMTFKAGSNVRIQAGSTQSIVSLEAAGTRSSPIRLSSTQEGIAGIISQPGGTVNGNYLLIRDNTVTGGAIFNADNSLDQGNVIGWNITELQPVALYWVGNGGSWDDLSHWSTTSGGTPDATELPGLLDDAIFDQNSFNQDGQIVSLPEGVEKTVINSIDWSGATNFPEFTSPPGSNLYVSGNLFFNAGMTSSLQQIFFETNNAGQTNLISSNGYLGGSVYFFQNGSWAFLDSISAGEISISQGNLSTFDNPVSVDLFTYDSFGNPISVDFGFSEVNVNSRWLVYEFSPASSNLRMSNMKLRVRGSFYANWNQSLILNYNHVIADGPSTRFFNSANFETLEITPGSLLLLQAGNTYAGETIIAEGTDAAPITIRSQTEGTQAIISKESGIVNATYLTIKDNRATGGAIFNGSNAIDEGNVEGWNLETGSDVAVSEATVSVNKTSAGTEVGIYARVTNIGPFIVQSSNMKYYLSTDDTWDTGDRELDLDIPVETLDPEETIVYTGATTLPGDLAEGNYYVINVYDPDDDIVEVRQGNNWEAIRIKITSTPPTQELIFQTLESAGGSSLEVAFDVQGDAEGNSYITGYFSGTASFGNLERTVQGEGTDIYVAKYNPDGEILWVSQIGSSSDNSELGGGITLDDSDNPIVLGYFDEVATFGNAGTLTSAGGTDGFVAKFDKNTGEILWAKRFGGENDDRGREAVVVNDRIYATGYIWGGGDVDGTPVQGDIIAQVIGVFDDTQAGRLINAQIDGTGFISNTYSITADKANGFIYAGGYIRNTISFGNTFVTTNNQSNDIYIAKYDLDLNLIDVFVGGGPSSDILYSLEFDEVNNVLYAAGDYFESMTLGGETVNAFGENTDGFVAKFDPDLNPLWVRTTGVDGQAFLRGLSVDENGGVIFGGGISGFLETPTKAIETQDDEDALIGRIESDGTLDFIDNFGGTNFDIVYGVNVANQKIHMSGYYFGTLDIPGVGRLASTGEQDIMIATAPTDRTPPGATPNFPTFYTVGSGSAFASVTATDENGIGAVKVRYKLITQPESSRQEVDAEDAGNGLYQFDLQAIGSDALGGDYIFDVFDNAGNKTEVAGSTWLEYSDGVNLSVPRVGSTENDFRLISYPLNITTNSAAAVFGGAYGNNNDSENRQYLLYRFDGSSAVANKSGNIELGKGYWFLTSQSSPSSISSGPGQVPTASEGSEFTTSVSQGWNLIGNPYGVNISRADFIAMNPGIDNRLEYYNGSTYSNESTMEPFKGYFIFSNSAGTIRFPVVSSSSSRTSDFDEVVENEISESDWGVRIKVKAGSVENDRPQIGMAHEAKDGKDQRDQVSLPKAFVFADLNFNNPKVDYQLVKDIQPSGENQRWTATFESNLENKLVTLEWDNSYWGSNDLTIVLYDKKREKIVDMREESSYQFRNTGEQEFEFIYGTEQFIAENVVPGGIEVSTYPNPFRGETTIEFALPETKTSYGVTLNIYNSTGQWVTTLVDDVFTKGFYKAKWDGRNASGTELNQGIYIYKLVVTDESGSKVESGRLIIR